MSYTLEHGHQEIWWEYLIAVDDNCATISPDCSYEQMNILANDLQTYVDVSFFFKVPVQSRAQ